MSFLQPSPVKYACSCGILNPINKLFFCRHCPKLRCGFCVCHEIESHFCSNCLENIPSSEARHKKNCCANCFDCPCCQHTLSARATTVPVVRKAEKPDESKEQAEAATEAVPATPNAKNPAMPTTKKMYYLSCLSCRWTTRDVGIPDQGVATGTWPDQECLYQVRFNTLMEYYQSVVLQEKQEKQEFLRRKAPKQHKFPSLTDRTGLTVSLIRRQIGWSEKNMPKTKLINIAPAEATAEVEALPPEIFTQPINLRNITTVAQRHSQPAEQPTAVSKLYPQRRCLWIKRSLRCRQCEHNLIKPEYHPTSIKYRIQLFASYHVPEVVLVRCEQPLVPGQLNGIFLKITNPTMYDMTIGILDEIVQEEKELNTDSFQQSCRIKEEAVTSSPLLKAAGGVTLARQNSTREFKREVRETSNATIIPLESEFVLSQRDDSKEFDEDVQAPLEEPKFIVWRKGNKVLIRLQFTPAVELQPGDTVTLGFYIQYTYVTNFSNTADKEPTTHALNSRLFIQAGNIAKASLN